MITTSTPLALDRETAGKAAGVVTITLDQPGAKVVVLDRALLTRLDAALDEAGPSPRGLVLASASRVFVAGADLKEISGLTDRELDEYLAFGQRVFGRIAALPCTSVAAINGAALGGGLELAMHCDVLLGLKPADPAKPYQVGLPEASLGICPGWGGANLLPARLDPAVAIGLTAAGKTMTVSESVDRGLIETLCDSQPALLAAARDRAAKPKPARSVPGEPRTVADVRESVQAALTRIETELPKTEAAAGVVAIIRAALKHGWKSALITERATLIRLRSTPAAQAALKAFFDRSAAR